MLLSETHVCSVLGPHGACFQRSPRPRDARLLFPPCPCHKCTRCHPASRPLGRPWALVLSREAAPLTSRASHWLRHLFQPEVPTPAPRCPLSPPRLLSHVPNIWRHSHAQEPESPARGWPPPEVTRGDVCPTKSPAASRSGLARACVREGPLCHSFFCSHPRSGTWLCPLPGTEKQLEDGWPQVVLWVTWSSSRDMVKPALNSFSAWGLAAPQPAEGTGSTPPKKGISSSWGALLLPRGKPC